MSGPTGEHKHGPGCGHQLDLTQEHIHTGDDCCGANPVAGIEVTSEVAGAEVWNAVGVVDPVGGGAIVTYTNSVVPVTVALNHGGVSGEPSFQPQVLISTGVTERGEVTYVGSPAIDAQRYSDGPDPSSFTVTGGAVTGGEAAWSSVAAAQGAAQTSQHGGAATWGTSAAGINPGQPAQQTAVGDGPGGVRGIVAGSVGTTSSTVVSSSITPSSGTFASSQQAQTWTAGVSSTGGALNAPVFSPPDSSAVLRPSQQRITSREDPQAASLSSRTVDSPAMRAATGELLSPRSAPGRGVESTASARVNLEESRGGAQRFDGAAADRQAQSRYARERPESSESRAELPKRADTPFR